MPRDHGVRTGRRGPHVRKVPACIKGRAARCVACLGECVDLSMRDARPGWSAQLMMRPLDGSTMTAPRTDWASSGRAALPSAMASDMWLCPARLDGRLRLGSAARDLNAAHCADPEGAIFSSGAARPLGALPAAISPRNGFEIHRAFPKFCTRRQAHIGHVIQLAQILHDEFADQMGRGLRFRHGFRACARWCSPSGHMVLLDRPLAQRDLHRGVALSRRTARAARCVSSR